MAKLTYTDCDKEAIKILQDFLPDKIFDAHLHFYADWDYIDDPNSQSHTTFKNYLSDMEPIFTKNRTISGNLIPYPYKELHDETKYEKMLEILKIQLDKYPGCTGELMLRPNDTAEDIEKKLIHPRICGLKCYHLYGDSENTFESHTSEFLPDSAWEIADKHGLCITLHMVKSRALSDPDNMNYIRTMAKRYPNATLILAHAARSFASWTAIEAVDQLCDLPNVWFDFSAVCESPAIFQIIKKIGTKRSMWGSDYNISSLRGKAISIADTFYWINESDLLHFANNTAEHERFYRSWTVGLENLMAVRQACILAELSRTDIEDIFYNNAHRLFFKE